MTWQPLPFTQQTLKHPRTDVSAQRLINFYPEVQPSGQNQRTQVALIGTPDLNVRQEIGTGPIRGMIPFKGKMMVVSGGKLYRWDSAGNVTEIGELPGVGRVRMAKSANEVGILTGTSEDDYFVATETTLQQVADEDFPGASDIAFIDQFFIFTRAGNGQWFRSELNDGTSFDAANIATAEGSPDLLIGLAVDHREVVLFGEETIEYWYNDGSSFSFARASGAFTERGLASKFSVARQDNSLFFLGNDGVVYRLNNYIPVPISDAGVEHAIEANKGWGDIFAFTYTQAGHPFYVLTKPDGFTFVYDVLASELLGRPIWHERQSYNRDYWLASTYNYAFDRHLIGNSSNGNIYEMEILDATGKEGDDYVVAEAVLPVLWSNAESFSINSLIVDAATGIGNTVNPAQDPRLMMAISRDGGHAWSNEEWRSLGLRGERTARCKWDALGDYDRASIRLQISDPVERTLLGAYADVERGSV